MSDSSTNVEIEDVLSSIRRLVSEDRAAARPVTEAVPPAPMVEAPVQTESATIAHFLPRGAPANHRPAPVEAPANAETRIDAAIVALNAETGRAAEGSETQESAVADAAADTLAEGELVDTSELLSDPYQQAGARGAQFVLTPDFLVETVEPETPEGPAQNTDLADAVEDAPAEDIATEPSSEIPAVAEDAPVQPSARPDLSLDDLVSGDALLATFGSIGPSPARNSTWDSDALADLAPRTAPRAYPLHPTLEATIADLEMAVAAQSEEFEPDLGEDLSLVSPPAFQELPASETSVAGASSLDAAPAADRMEWEAAEASVEAAMPMRRHRFHLNAGPGAAPGYIGISDAFPAEDRDIGNDPAGPALIAKAPTTEPELAEPEAQDTERPAWPSVASFGEDYADLAVDGPNVYPEQVTDEALLGLGDAIDAPRIAVDMDNPDPDEATDARAGESEGYPDDPGIGTGSSDPAAQAEAPSVESESWTEPEPVVATPARRIFIAPRADVAEDDTWTDAEFAASAPEPDDAEMPLAEVVSGAVTDALTDDLAEAVNRGLEASPAGEDASTEARLELPPSAELWQIVPASPEGDEGIATDLAPLGGEELRSLVLDLIRQELQGPLGERITRNVRKLVRREINRALESRDLD